MDLRGYTERRQSPETKITLFNMTTCGLNKIFSVLKGGDLHCEDQVAGPPPLLLQWGKTDHALVMLFNNGTLQV